MINIDCSRLLKAQLQLRVFGAVYSRHFAVINLWVLDDPAVVPAQIREGELLLVAGRGMQRTAVMGAKRQDVGGGGT